VGLEVETDLGVKLGKVDHLLETGANDVLVVVDGEVERLIPFLQPQTVLKVDLANQLLVVDWDPDF
jgi:16S rRNA processing protein RimM